MNNQLFLDTFEHCTDRYGILHVDTAIVSVVLGALSHLLLIYLYKYTWVRHYISILCNRIINITMCKLESYDRWLVACCITLWIWIFTMNIADVLPTVVIAYVLQLITKDPSLRFQCVCAEDPSTSLAVAIVVLSLNLIFTFRHSDVKSLLGFYTLSPINSILFVPFNICVHLLEYGGKLFNTAIRVSAAMFASGIVCAIACQSNSYYSGIGLGIWYVIDGMALYTVPEVIVQGLIGSVHVVNTSDEH